MSKNSETKNSTRAIIVPASAGSGKTFRIAHEYIYDALRNHKRGDDEEGFDPTVYKRILAVTFTNKATEEMKGRILKEIHLLAANQESDHLAKLIEETGLDEQELRRRAKVVRNAILHDYSHFTVLTNDTFFQRVLRAFIRELGFDINFTTELDSSSILQKSVDALIEDISTNKELRKWLEGLTKENIEEGGSWSIRPSIEKLNKELFKESNRDIIDRISNKEKIKTIVDEFSKNADTLQAEYIALAEEALAIMKRWDVNHKDFSGGFTSYLDNAAKGEFKDIGPSHIAKITGEAQDWLTKDKRKDAKLMACATELQPVGRMVYEKGVEIKNIVISRDIIRKNYRSFALLHDLQQKVAEICRDDNMVLLSNTKHAIAKFISEPDDTPFIYEKVGNYFDKFMIDEFQDTSSKEWSNFLPLLKNAMAQRDDVSVLIVGDVKQSIYRFRGSNWNILGSIAPQDLADYESVPLEHNWRSLPNIVKFNNLLFKNLVDNGNNMLNDMLDEAKRTKGISEDKYNDLYDTLTKAYSKYDQIAARKHINEGYVHITYTPLEVQKKQKEEGLTPTPLYIERIKELLNKGFLPRDITILVRYKSEGRRIAEELLAARKEFPEEHQFEITTEEALSIESSPAAKFILSIMRLAINRNDTSSLAYYNYICHGEEFNRELDEEEIKFLDKIRMTSPEEAFEQIIINYKSLLDGQTAYVQALHNQIVGFSAGKTSDIALFDKWWREVGSEQSVRIERSDRAIEVMTIHKSKGLENKVIIIPFCSWDYQPKIDNNHSRSNIVWAESSDNSGLSDLGPFPVQYNKNVEHSVFADGFYYEKVYTFVDAVNILYVATTRAKEQLHIFYKPTPKASKTVGALLMSAINGLTTTDDKGLIHYTLGEFETPEVKMSDKGEEKRIENILLDEYHASPIGVKFRTCASRYFGEEQDDLSPRSMGIKLHRAFEYSSTREDIFSALAEMELEGTLSKGEHTALTEQISATLNNTIAGEWFSDKWENVDRERSIIRPKDSAKRPDRIMRCGDEAVVVDYKFGKPTHSHKEQICEYISALRNMGYKSVKGYLWYVAQGEIVEVDEVTK